ncbi:hypothetical protein ACFSSA_00805 [Luteolibacter algae]|uniref:Anti-sigma factor n=1 Tax=Luteolibacter algae TaxID=454151 RepID=A0ABW5D6G4_9BACT
MNPDETTLALWLDDELQGPELAEMNLWAQDHPDQLAAREELRAYREMMAGNIPASEEPPFPDFFLSRVNQGIRDLQLEEQKAVSLARPSEKRAFWKSWLMPAAACAGMVFAFGIGRKTSDGTSASVAQAPASQVSSPMVYTPEEGVNAHWFASNQAGAAVIVLEGVTAIPDSTDFSETVYVPTIREADRTATHDNFQKTFENQ